MRISGLLLVILLLGLGACGTRTGLTLPPRPAPAAPPAGAAPADDSKADAGTMR